MTRGGLGQGQDMLVGGRGRKAISSLPLYMRDVLVGLGGFIVQARVGVDIPQLGLASGYERP